MRIERVRDGDTLNVVLSLLPTLGVDFRVACRVASLNCPERSTPEGVIARQFTIDWAAEHAAHASAGSQWPFLSRVDGWDNYGGRYDGAIQCWVGHDLGQALLIGGQAQARQYRALLPEQDA